MQASSSRRQRRRIEWADLDPIGVGAELRAAREALGVPIEQAAAETRIRPSYLDALEDESYSRLPAGVAGRGLLRTYATYLGLDAIELLSALDAHGRLPVGPAVIEHEVRRRPSSHSLAPRLAGVVFAIVCVLGLTYYMYSQYSAFRTAEAAPVARATVTSRGGSPTPPPSPSPSPSSSPTPPASPSPTVLTQPTVRQASFALAASSPSPTPRPLSPTATTVRLTPKASPTPISPTPTPVELVVEARFSADVHATVQVDGEVVEDGTISANDERTWRGSSITLQVDNAGAVEILLDGRTTGLLGADGADATETWTR